MLGRILKRSLWKRKGKLAIALFSVAIGAAVATSMLTVSMGMEDQINREFRKFGANLLVVPRSDTIDVGIGGVGFGSVTEQQYINESDIWKIKTIAFSENILGYAPFLYQVVTAAGPQGAQQAVLAGTWFEKNTVLANGERFPTGINRIDTWWDVRGEWVHDGAKDEVMVGESAAKKLGVDVGAVLPLTFSPAPGMESSVDLTVVGIVSTGASEDEQLFADLDLVQNLTNRQGMVHSVQVSALCTACPVDDFATEIEEKMPGTEGKTVKQLASAEMNILDKFNGMMLMATAAAFTASVVGVTTTMMTSVMERGREIGLMKSIGAGSGSIASLFLAEAVIIGVLGAAAGFAAGQLLANSVAGSVFGSTVGVQASVIPWVFALSISITVLAAAVPVYRALGVEPAAVLRGE